MLCPNCKEKMEADVVDDQAILHCPSCGGTFFAENGINRISNTTAQKLAADKKNNQILTGDKVCPNDNTLLKPLKQEESIPQDVILLRCNTCQGIFAHPNDLVIFKKAQSVKIDYFKIWGIPLPSIKSVAVLSILLFSSIVSLMTYFYWQRRDLSTYIQAQDLIKNFYLSSSERYLFISFKTLIPLKSRVVFSDTTSNQEVEKEINGQLQTFHQLTTADVNLENEILYQIILQDQKGREIQTGIKKLELN